MAWGAVCVLEVAVRVSHGCNQIFLPVMGSKGVEMRRTYKGIRAPHKRYRQKSGTVSQAWKWAEEASDRRRVGWRIGLKELMRDTIQQFLIKRNATSNSGTAIPYPLYKWRVYGFDCYWNRQGLTIKKFLGGIK